MTSPPAIVDELLEINDDAVALWLLRRLANAEPGQRGRNLIGDLLTEWFPGIGGIGFKQQVDQTGIPLPINTKHGRIERGLEDAYALLMSRTWIAPDPSSGGTFCRLAERGARLLTARVGHDPERVAFAAKALTVELHPALQALSIDTHFREGQFETALRDSATYLEDAIRTLGNLSAGTVGVKLAGKAFAAPNGPLTDQSELGGQAAGLQNLFMGFFGAIRNLISHTAHQYADPKEAFELLMLVDYLTGKLDVVAQRLGKTLP